MPWIRSHSELSKHPKIIKAARLLSVSIPAIIGHLHMLWWWCIEYAPDGEIGCFDADDIAAAAGWEGNAEVFITALINCGRKGSPGLLDQNEDSLSIHDWEEHCGKDYEKRQKEAERLRLFREKKKEQQTPKEQPENSDKDSYKQTANGDNTQYDNTVYEVRTQYDFERTANVHGEKEKEKENIKTKTKNLGQGDALDRDAEGEVELQNSQETRVGQPQEGETPEKIAGNGGKAPEYPAAFEEFWAAYPRKVAKKESYIAWKGEATNAEKRQEVMRAVKNYAAYVIQNKKSSEYILHAKTFMHKERWMDWIRSNPDSNGTLGNLTQEEKDALRAKYTDGEGICDDKAMLLEYRRIRHERGLE